MAIQHKQQVIPTQEVVSRDPFKLIRRHRLMQICTAVAFGLMLSLLVARNMAFTIFAIGLGFLLVALVFAIKHKVLTSAYILLGSLASMLFALAVSGAGLFDIAVLGYPALLIFAAILGGATLFISVLMFVVIQCILMTWLTLQGIITPQVPTLSWPHLLFVLVIFVLTGFSVHILVRDVKRLMSSLQSENTKVQKSQNEIEHLAHHDTLTNLPNRFYGEELFTKSLIACKAKNQSLALLFIDLDNFKPVNDALGHAAGDLLLEHLTLRLKKTIKPDHFLIRFGGDEFILLAPFLDDYNEIDKLANTLILGFASEFEILGNRVSITASIGIACAPNDGSDFKNLCRKADLAMYKAKQDGRNTYHYYNQALDTASDDKFKLLQLLRPAINQDKFTLYYQPLMGLHSGQINTVEALLRWPQPDGSMISPEQFIPLAESSGLINELGRWVIQQACLFCALQRSKGLSNLRVAVNLSIMQFKDERLYSTVVRALEDACLPGSALELELTESLLIDETEQIQNQLKALSELGISIAIDDFGTGYSNLGYLRNLNATRLKIDRSFITSMCAVKQDESLVRAIISMAGALGLETVAEGIEDQATLKKLITLGCDVGQGYFWSEPLPGDALFEYLSEHQQHNTTGV